MQLIILVLMLLAGRSTAATMGRGIITVQWDEPHNFCGGVLGDLVWSVCPYHHEDDKIPEEFKNKHIGNKISNDCCKSKDGCTPLFILEHYCVNPLRADTTKALKIYDQYNRPKGGLPITEYWVKRLTATENSNPSHFKPITQPSPLTTHTSTSTTTTNKMRVPTIESLYWESRVKGSECGLCE